LGAVALSAKAQADRTFRCELCQKRIDEAWTLHLAPGHSTIRFRILSRARPVDVPGHVRLDVPVSPVKEEWLW